MAAPNLSWSPPRGEMAATIAAAAAAVAAIAEANNTMTPWKRREQLRNATPTAPAQEPVEQGLVVKIPEGASQPSVGEVAAPTATALPNSAGTRPVSPLDMELAAPLADLDESMSDASFEHMQAESTSQQILNSSHHKDEEASASKMRSALRALRDRREALAKAKAEIVLRRQDNIRLRHELQDVQEQLRQEKAKNTNEDKTQENNRLRDLLEGVQKELEEEKSGKPNPEEVQALRDQIRSLYLELATERATATAMTSSSTHLRTEIKTVKKSLEEARRRVFELVAENEAVRGLLVTARADMEEARLEQNTNSARAEAAAAQAAELRSQLAKAQQNEATWKRRHAAEREEAQACRAELARNVDAAKARSKARMSPAPPGGRVSGFEVRSPSRKASPAAGSGASREISSDAETDLFEEGEAADPKGSSGDEAAQPEAQGNEVPAEVPPSNVSSTKEDGADADDHAAAKHKRRKVKRKHKKDKGESKRKEKKHKRKHRADGDENNNEDNDEDNNEDKNEDNNEDNNEDKNEDGNEDKNEDDDEVAHCVQEISSDADTDVFDAGQEVDPKGSSGDEAQGNELPAEVPHSTVSPTKEDHAAAKHERRKEKKERKKEKGESKKKEKKHKKRRRADDDEDDNEDDNEAAKRDRKRRRRS